MSKSVCAFCGEPNKISSEHVWGRWIGPLIGVGTIDFLGQLMGETEPPAVIHRLTGEATAKNVSFASPELNHKVKAPCGPCNNGWMSRLENDAKQILSSMIRSSGSTEIASEAQTLIATWAIKTAMVCEYLDSSPDRPIYFKPDERRWVMEKRCPPDGVFVWICHCRAPQIVQGANQHLKVSRDGTDSYAYLSTHAVGDFAFQVLAHRPRLAGTEHVRIREGPWEQSLCRIWPNEGRSLVWPPPLTLTGHRWRAFCNRVAGFAAP